ncbi:MAG TPA: hypothetical protein VM802_19055 [Chitinophaga sp.]|uniref:terpene synthase family protein n=1 Tax=Chitinophaga sp. TaxID=1869181 RepID=UPI002B64F7C4|nr:hypothetical protein [Chitinophaga sp.]HVI46986.1 hypothetical protein [Chitinophaga sp.]
MNTFDPNALRYPFPYATNRHAQTMEKKIGEWLLTDYSFLPEKVRKKYITTGVGHAGGCLFPRANEAQLTAICRFFLWAFTIDDSFEFSSVGQLETIRGKAMKYLRGIISHSKEPLYLHLPILRNELLQLGSERWLNRFNTSLETYFDGIQQEIPFRKNMTFPTWEQFIAIREKAVNVHTLVNLAELITGCILPDQVIFHPVIQELTRLTCRILSWENDFFSAHMEKGNDVLNLVLMMEHEQQCSTEEAYQHAINFHNEDLRQFCSLVDTLPNFTDYTHGVKAFIENLSFMIHGHFHWGQTLTKRYDSMIAGHPSDELKDGNLSINA